MTSAIDQGTNQRRGIALTISVGLHIALLLFFIFWKIITPIPPFPDKEGGGSGFELALGFTELGMGDNSQDQTPSTPAAQQEATPPPASENEVLTSEVDENNVAVKPTDKDKPKPDKPRPQSRSPPRSSRNRSSRTN